MSSKRLAMFPHRQNDDGTFDSICPYCFSTVARGLHTERQLVAFEEEHVCLNDLSGEPEVRFQNVSLTSRRVFEILKGKTVGPAKYAVSR
jgi:hypothetical protein